MKMKIEDLLVAIPEEVLSRLQGDVDVVLNKDAEIIEALGEALAFYADKKGWENGSINADRGEKASSALLMALSLAAESLGDVKEMMARDNSE